MLLGAILLAASPVPSAATAAAPSPARSVVGSKARVFSRRDAPSRRLGPLRPHNRQLGCVAQPRQCWGTRGGYRGGDATASEVGGRSASILGDAPHPLGVGRGAGAPGRVDAPSTPAARRLHASPTSLQALAAKLSSVHATHEPCIRCSWKCERFQARSGLGSLHVCVGLTRDWGSCIPVHCQTSH